MQTVTEKLRKEIDVFSQSIEVIPNKNRDTIRYLSKDDSNYSYNQLETLNKIDRFYNSQYSMGKLDSQGQRKTFLNIVKFSADVSAKQTDMDVKDFTFIPDTKNDVDTTWAAKRMFTIWNRENEYGSVINELNSDYSKYGTAVIKKVGTTLERVNLKTLLNTQEAKSLKEAVEGGGYVIQKHELTYHQMKQFPSWDLTSCEGAELDEKFTVYERHALVPLKEIEEDSDEDTLVLAVSFIVLDQKKEGDTVLFIEQEDKLPFEEVHWSKQDGRWLGLGEVENQFENQIARNLTANLRRRNLLWGSKKLFQSADTDMVGKNLVKEVSDGDVLEIGVNGGINQVNTQSQHGVDFNADDAAWAENSRQKSFMFEVNTGESLPSGTPFRLGVILSNASQTHFNLKRENFGFFLERSFFNQLIPIFKKKVGSKEFVLTLGFDEEGIERYRNALINHEANKRLRKKILDKDLVRNLETLQFDFAAEKEKVIEELQDEPYFFLTIPPKTLDDMKFRMELSITGEEINIEKQVESLSSLLQVLAPDDPRREDIIRRIISLVGMDAGSILPKAAPTLPNPSQDLTQAFDVSPTNQGAEAGPTRSLPRE